MHKNDSQWIVRLHIGKCYDGTSWNGGINGSSLDRLIVVTHTNTKDILEWLLRTFWYRTTSHKEIYYDIHKSLTLHNLWMEQALVSLSHFHLKSELLLLCSSARIKSVWLCSSSLRICGDGASWRIQRPHQWLLQDSGFSSNGSTQNNPIINLGSPQTKNGFAAGNSQLFLQFNLRTPKRTMKKWLFNQ